MLPKKKRAIIMITMPRSPSCVLFKSVCIPRARKTPKAIASIAIIIGNEVK